MPVLVCSDRGGRRGTTRARVLTCCVYERECESGAASPLELGWPGCPVAQCTPPVLYRLLSPASSTAAHEWRHDLLPWRMQGCKARQARARARAPVQGAAVVRMPKGGPTHLQAAAHPCRQVCGPPLQHAYPPLTELVPQEHRGAVFGGQKLRDV